MSAERTADRRALDAFDELERCAPQDRQASLEALLVGDGEALVIARRMLKAASGPEILPTIPPEPIDPLAGATPPERVGVYRLVAPIGAGGMGMVYRGERIEGGFEQSVAVKLIRSSLFSPAAAEQFAQERRILARLHHPHITQLHDGGTTTEGLSYIVMELVSGPSITDYAAQAALAVRQRLALFRDVCDAVGYAHREGVIHADIKPSNIVVDVEHGVKLLDFGIAGLLGAEIASAGPRARTPHYSSPQQARGDPPTPADDIFALGRLLGALVEGCAGADGELAAVIAMASAEASADRYLAVAELSDDIGRWLEGHPVAALPQSRTRTLAFFVRRHRLGVAAAAAAVAGLVAAVAITSVLYVRAETARRQAEQRFEEVRALSRYMLTDVTEALQKYPGTGRLRRDLAVRGRSYLERLSEIPGASPQLRFETADGYARTGDILGAPSSQNLGDIAGAKADLARAEAGLRSLTAAPGLRDEAGLALARALTSRAVLSQVADNDAKRAETLLNEACALAAGVAARRPTLASARLAHAECMTAHASLLDYEGRFGEMAAPVDSALADLAWLDGKVDPTRRALLVASAYNLRGDAHYYLDRRDAALVDYAAAAAVLDVSRRREADIRVLDRYAYTAFNIAGTLDDMGRSSEAIAWIDRGATVADQMRIFEDSPRAWHLANILHMQRALVLSSLGRFDEAIAEATANIVSRRAGAAAAPDNYEAARAVPVGLRPLGDVYAAAGRRREACATYLQAQASWDALRRRGVLAGYDASGELKVLQKALAICR